MLFNTDSSFVGLEKLKHVHHKQIGEFEEWAAHNEWEKFHYNHFDWWVFPVNRRSSYGLMWVVYEGEIDQLKCDPQFLGDYRRGILLVSASWGWDLAARTYLPNPHPGQCWHHWPIRLYKAAQSVQLFGFDNYFESLRIYALGLIGKGEPFLYNNRDLSELFN